MAVRNADLAQSADAQNAVLAALGEPAQPTAGHAVEIVIRRPDNSFTSVIEPQGPGQINFAPGQNVTIVEAAATVLRPD